MKIPITIFFGERDWMYSRAPLNSNFDANPLIKQRIIENASHHIYLDNPYDLVNGLMEDIQRIPECENFVPNVGLSKII